MTSAPQQRARRSRERSPRERRPRVSTRRLLATAGWEIRDRRLNRSLFAALTLIGTGLVFWTVRGFPHPGFRIVVAVVAAFILEWIVFTYRRLRRKPVFESLACRGEVAAVPILLEREEYHPMWPEAPMRLNVYRCALATLAPLLKPEDFHRLTDEQVVKLCGLAFYPASRLSAAALSALERAGDGRAVRALAQYRFQIYRRPISALLDEGLDVAVRAISDRAQEGRGLQS